MKAIGETMDKKKNKRKAEETFEKESMLGKVNSERKRRQRMLDQIMNNNVSKYAK